MSRQLAPERPRARQRRLAEYFDRVLGPQKVGGVYWSGYWHKFYVVLHIERDMLREVWSITVADPDELVAGTARRHMTGWDYNSGNQVVMQPDE